ncbi:MAG TPA: ABC transporter permease [Flavobacteriales bacterium]|jgi:putative ABC transport system permease protein|nr:ABC transporter permease [Flavobacteriales bacterium]HQV38963.1 ABC transporter permease [Flavobacteriales bacterium]
MNPRDMFRSALRSINRNRTRALLTMLGIIIGVGAVIGMLAVGKGSEESIKGELGKLGSNLIAISPGTSSRSGVDRGAGSLTILEERDVKEILRYSPSVKYISPMVQSQVQLVNGSANSLTPITGAYADYFHIQNHEVVFGKAFDDETGKSLKKVCVIGKTVADDLFGGEQASIGQILRVNKMPFRVLGVLKEKGEGGFGQDQDNVIIAPFRSVQKRILGIDYAMTIMASAMSEESVDAAKAEIDDVLLNRLEKVSGREPAFTIRTQKEIMDIMGSITGMITLLLATIASISLIVGGIGIMNIMLVSVTERTREIGLRLAVGAPGQAILIQFLVEAVLLSLIGGIIGIILGYVIAELAGQALNWETTVSFASVAMAFGFSFAIGVIFGFFPARKAAQLHPIEALRYE